MRRVLRALAAVLVAVAAVVVLLLVLQNRDRSTFSQAGGPAVQAAGMLPDQGHAHRAAPTGFHFVSDPPASGPHRPVALRRGEGALSRDELLQAVELGDVVLVYGADRDAPLLRGLRDDVAGPFVPALAAAGQAILLDRRPGARGVVAVAWRRLLRVASPADPRLRAFADAWLGRGCCGKM